MTDPTTLSAEGTQREDALADAVRVPRDDEGNVTDICQSTIYNRALPIPTIKISCTNKHVVDLFLL